MQYIIYSDNHVLFSWFEINYLKINAAEMQAVAIGPSQYEHDFHLNDRNVEMQDTLKILGVILDSKLNFIAETRQDSKDGTVRPIKHIVSCT